MAQSHEEMIKEFAKMASALGGGTTKPNKAKLIARKIGAEAGKLTIAVLGVLALSVIGWVFLDALNEIGVLTWAPTLWQGIRLIAPILLLIIAVPISVNVRLKQ